MFNLGKLKKPIIIAGAVVAAVIVAAGSLSIYTYAHDSIFPGITVGDVSLSGCDVESATALLDESGTERYKDKKIKVSLDDVYERDVTADDLGITFSSKETAEEAMKIGHDGGFFKRIGDVVGCIFGTKDLDMSININEEKKAALLSDFSRFDVAPQDASYSVDGETLTLHPRTDGKKLNVEAFSESLISQFREENYEDLKLARDVSESVALDMDKVYSEVHKEVKDAHVEKTSDGSKIVAHVVGVDFDLDAAKKKYSETPDDVITIPLKLTMPKVQTKHLETNLFKYCLSSVETHFSPKKVERTANVRLAAKLINGTVLNPGEEFSYNKTVGPRTKARGFKEAAIFAQGEVVDGIGGGICQVSSTLYMAALRANMKTTQRANHSFYVDYAPKGEDATVVYGSLDFRFVNTSKYPIKIVASSQNNWIRVQIMGTEPDEPRTVKLTKKTLSTTPFSTKQKPTTSLAAGKTKVEQKGQEGLTMQVYRNVYDKNGKLVESYLENTSKYKPMPQIVLVGSSGASTPAAATTPAAPAATTPAAPAATTPAPAPETPAPAPATPAPAEAPKQEQPTTEAPASSDAAPAEPAADPVG